MMAVKATRRKSQSSGGVALFVLALAMVFGVTVGRTRHPRRRREVRRVRDGSDDLDPSIQQPANKAREFLTTILNTYEQYHNHKESMAYAGFTLYALLVGSAALSSWWPLSNAILGFLISTLTWLLALTYLGYPAPPSQISVHKSGRNRTAAITVDYLFSEGG